MSKPWFLDIALNNGSTTVLSHTIQRILKGDGKEADVNKPTSATALL